MIWQTASTSSENTEQLAEKIGRAIKGGEIIELVSDLGGGKTTFVRGLARGVGSTDQVASPTFTISRMYEAGGLRIYHFDFYRLQEAGVVGNELAEAMSDTKGVTVIEWSDIVQNILPPDRMTVTITRTGDDARQLVFEYPETMAHLLNEVQK